MRDIAYGLIAFVALVAIVLGPALATAYLTGSLECTSSELTC